MTEVIEKGNINCRMLHCLKKNQKTSRPSEHPPGYGGKNVKTFRWDQKPLIRYGRLIHLALEVDIHLTGENRVKRSREKPYVIDYCIIIFISVQGLQNLNKELS